MPAGCHPCPGVGYGTHSLSRARRLLTYFEERDLLVVRTDFSGRRIVAFPDLELETAAGDPDAPDEAAAPSGTGTAPDAVSITEQTLPLQ